MQLKKKKKAKFWPKIDLGSNPYLTTYFGFGPAAWRLRPGDWWLSVYWALEWRLGTSQVVQWLRPHLPRQGVWVQPGTKIPQALWPKNQNIKQKQYYSTFNKDFKIVHIKKKLKKRVIGGWNNASNWRLKQRLKKRRSNTLRESKCLRLLVLSHSVVSESAIPWTVAHQAPLSMGIL